MGRLTPKRLFGIFAARDRRAQKGSRDTAIQLTIACDGGFPTDLMKWERRMWKLKLIGLLMTIVYWAFSLILVYSVMMSIFRYAFGVQLPNPFAIFQGR